MLQTILVLDPTRGSLRDLEAAFRAELTGGCSVETVSSGKELTLRLRGNGSQQLVVVHEQLGDGTFAGSQLIARIRKAQKDVPIVVVAEQGNVDSAGRAIQAGATDFLVLGDRLQQRIATLLGKLQGFYEVIDRNRLLDEQNARLRDELQSRIQIVGQSPQIKRLIDVIRRVAQVPRPVLIVGERGTGKELVARAIHAAGKSASKPMIVVNCAAFGDALLESELFGHEKGAFTGADTRRIGKFELADGGTLFLDEIGHMSLAFQQKILRVVEYGTFTRVGGTSEIRTTARMIAATNCDLETRIREGRFLADLRDRLAFETIEVQPLRRRRSDVEILARHFLEQFAQEIPGFAGKSLSRSTIAALRRYDFPGNVRELKNIIERAAYRDTGSEIMPDDLGIVAAAGGHPDRGTFEQRIDTFRRKLISDAMTEAKSNQAEAARILGLSYHQFRYFFKKYVSPHSNS